MPAVGNRNSAGEVITERFKLKNSSYVKGFDDSGEPIIDWDSFKSEFADKHGFDMRNQEENGDYYIETILPKGTMLIRYGNESGRFTAPKGTRYDELALPYIEETVEYHEYRVTKDQTCLVWKGKVAPNFDSEGGGVQFFHFHTAIRFLVKEKVLERIYR